MDKSQEIEVEVVEVGESRPVERKPEHRSGRENNHTKQGNPFHRGIPRVRQLRIPALLWPLVIIVGVVVFAIALILAMLAIIPFLIIRAIVRLLFGTTR